MTDTGNKNGGFNKLWAPWRMEYINGMDDSRPGGCIFCEKPAQDKDDENYLVYRGETAFIILNLFPYNNGHLMVVPYTHTASLGELPPEAKLEMMELTRLAMEAIGNTMRPDGFNVGMNVGKTAGAGIDQHLHMHVVPRWNGDTNFMPVLGCTKVICEALGDTYRKLKEEIERISRES